MAFTKKKDDEPAAPAGEADEADDALTGAFAPAGEPEPGQDSAGPGTPDEAPAGEAAPVAEAPAPDALGGADALLSMFNNTESMEDDRSVILDLAGEVDIADLLDDLHTVAAALGLAAAEAAAAEPTPLVAEEPAPLAAAA